MYIFAVGHFLNIFMEHDLNVLMIFGIKKKIYVFLAIATNIPQRLKTAFVLQGHIFYQIVASMSMIIRNLGLGKLQILRDGVTLSNLY